MEDRWLAKMLNLIRLAGKPAELHSLRNEAQQYLKSHVQSLPIDQCYEQLNEVHDAVICRAITLAEAEMARLGMGAPPVPYAYLLFGSGGREEQTMSSDQDSGIVFSDGEGASSTRQYFSLLSERIVRNLLESGYPPCDGNVISSNAEWCLSIEEWKNRLEGWFNEPVWENVRYLLILADGRCVHGDQMLANELKSYFYKYVLNHSDIEKRMLENTIRHKILVGVFGQLLREPYGSEAGSLDIKYGAYIPMVNAIRLLSIQAGIPATSTLERLSELIKQGYLNDSDGNQYYAAFSQFLSLRLLTTSQLEHGWHTSNGKLAADKLDKAAISKLKGHLKAGKKLQQYVYKHTLSRLSQGGG